MQPCLSVLDLSDAAMPESNMSGEETGEKCNEVVLGWGPCELWNRVPQVQEEVSLHTAIHCVADLHQYKCVCWSLKLFWRGVLLLFERI